MAKKNNAQITMEELQGYLDEALTDSAGARVEKALRESPPLRMALSRIMKERDRGEHSIGAIWRRHRLTCPNREELGGFLLGILEKEASEYIKFHIESIGCAYCHANLTDLEARKKESTGEVRGRRQRIFESSRGQLKR